MSDATQVCGATTAVATFTAGYTAVQVPLSARDVDALGVEDEAAAISRLARPCEVADFAPTGATGWDRFAEVLKEVWKNLELRDMVFALNLHVVTMNTVSSNPQVVFDSFVQNIFEYFKEEVTGILELLWKLVTLLAEVADCRMTFWRATAKEFAEAVLSGEFEPLIILGTLEQECELFRDVVEAIGSLQQTWNTLSAMGFQGIVDHLGEFSVTVVEMLRDADLQKKALEMAVDPVKLGGFYGTVYGFVFWEVLETLLTGPLGKVGKAVKVVLK